MNKVKICELFAKNGWHSGSAWNIKFKNIQDIKFVSYIVDNGKNLFVSFSIENGKSNRVVINTLKELESYLEKLELLADIGEIKINTWNIPIPKNNWFKIIAKFPAWVATKAFRLFFKEESKTLIFTKKNYSLTTFGLMPIHLKHIIIFWFQFLLIIAILFNFFYNVWK